MADISKIDMERINGLLDKLEEVTNKINSMKYVIDSGSNDNGWYRKWSDGFIEQWGIIKYSDSKGERLNQSTTLIIPFTNTSYYVSLISINSNNTQGNSCAVLSKTVNSFNWSSSYWWARDAYTSNYNWYACGY